jgi:hypothetical protein
MECNNCPTNYSVIPNSWQAIYGALERPGAYGLKHPVFPDSSTARF